MEILDRKKTDIYGDDIYLYFTIPIDEFAVTPHLGNITLIGKDEDRSWHIQVDKWENEEVSFFVNADGNRFVITFDDLGDYKVEI